LEEWNHEKAISIDIMLDLGVITSDRDIARGYSDLRTIINGCLIDSETFSRIIIAISTFPEDLSNIPAGQNVQLARLDIKLFERVLNDFVTIKNHLAFSDYGVTKFTETDIDFSKLKLGILPKAKYTTSDFYWVLKGKKHHLTKHGSKIIRQ
jgi:hypothetical protein